MSRPIHYYRTGNIVKASGITADTDQGDATGITADTDQGDATGITLEADQGDATGITLEANQGDATGITADTDQGDATGITLEANQGDATGITSGCSCSRSTQNPKRQRNGLLLTTDYARGQSCHVLPTTSYKGSALHG
ncbi:hypothetical protein [Pseudomonas syringae group sp. J309-1]|uniref:hypothetical protein n=1 Tax=Pseudomonas syringae group sp. J309-1 TaxID=3079588 RepID=UPI0029081278|nr:hypothetical protein [Pseudomonas syringae group sp. J309-1]MDU8358502.1 hypothetical protein [Pseudomonas syringae group sp. J309-1]